MIKRLPLIGLRRLLLAPTAELLIADPQNIALELIAATPKQAQLSGIKQITPWVSKLSSELPEVR